MRCLESSYLLENSDEFEIWVEFIEPTFFKDELIHNNSFTINEASKIIGEGKVKSQT